MFCCTENLTIAREFIKSSVVVSYLVPQEYNITFGEYIQYFLNWDEKLRISFPH